MEQESQIFSQLFHIFNLPQIKKLQQDTELTVESEVWFSCGSVVHIRHIVRIYIMFELRLMMCLHLMTLYISHCCQRSLDSR